MISLTNSNFQLLDNSSKFAVGSAPISKLYLRTYITDDKLFQLALSESGFIFSDYENNVGKTLWTGVTEAEFSRAVKTTGVSDGKTVTLFVSNLNDTQNYVQFFVDGVDKGYIIFDVSRNTND